MKRSLFKISENGLRVFFLVLGSILSTIVLVFAITSIIQVQAGNIEQASGYLFAIFVVLGLSRLVTYVKEKTRISLIRFLSLLVVDVAIGVLVFFGKDWPYFYSLCGGLFCLTIIASRVFKIIQNHTVRSLILNAILILAIALLAIGLFIPYEGADIYSPLLVLCLILVFCVLAEILSNAFSQLKLKTLFQIIFRTFALEIILGLLTLMVAASIVFMYFEPNITSFAEGLWYSFATVTTIGFGDYAATTIIGRIATVILGIYGIVVVAVITSIIVNFYNETAGKKDAKEIKEINQENKEKKK